MQYSISAMMTGVGVLVSFLTSRTYPIMRFASKPRMRRSKSSSFSIS